MRLRFIASVLFVSAIGCPGSLSDIDRFYVDAGDDGGSGDAPILEPIDSGGDTTPFVCPDIVTGLFQTTCGVAGCHAAPDAEQGLDLQSPNVVARLYNVPTKGNPAIKLINPQAPEQSAIYTKLTPTPPFGVRMPPVPVDPALPQCVLDWVRLIVAADGGLGGDATTSDAAGDAAAD